MLYMDVCHKIQKFLEQLVGIVKQLHLSEFLGEHNLPSKDLSGKFSLWKNKLSQLVKWALSRSSNITEMNTTLGCGRLIHFHGKFPISEIILY